MAFPSTRFRRLRRGEAIRRIVRETRLDPADLVQPLFVVEGEGIDRPIPGFPGQRHLSPDLLAEEALGVAEAGCAGVLLFGLPDRKDADGSSAWDDDGVVQRGVRAIRARAPELPVITDVCLCQYTDHGSCGVLGAHGDVDNDATIELLARVAVSHAEAGAAFVAPSDMMDGRVGAIRTAPRRRRSRRDRPHQLQREVRLRLLRPVPRGGRLGARGAAIAAATRSIRRTAARACASRSPTSTRARTC